jgi:KUP system potassium uptake protein
MRFMYENQTIALSALGAVVLALTGAEALYADMGHFGKTADPRGLVPDRVPGAGAELPGPGRAAATSRRNFQPVLPAAGAWSVYPLVVLSTGGGDRLAGDHFRHLLDDQASHRLGLLPRMRILHTSASEIGQIYIPAVNWLQIVVLLAVIGFGSSDKLAGAYGIAVTATMLATTFLTFFVIRYRWHLPLALCIAATGFFIAIRSFVLGQHPEAVPRRLVPAAAGRGAVHRDADQRGRELVFENLQKHAIPLEEFLSSLFVAPPTRLRHRHLHARRERRRAACAAAQPVAQQGAARARGVPDRAHHRRAVRGGGRAGQGDGLGHQCYQLNIYYGFKDEPDIPRVLQLCECLGLPFEMMETSFFIARQTVISAPGSGMATWREHLFVAMSRNARGAADYYQIPPNRVIELGTQVEI